MKQRPAIGQSKWQFLKDHPSASFSLPSLPLVPSSPSFQWSRIFAWTRIHQWFRDRGRVVSFLFIPSKIVHQTTTKRKWWDIFFCHDSLRSAFVYLSAITEIDISRVVSVRSMAAIVAIFVIDEDRFLRRRAVSMNSYPITTIAQVF